MSGICVYVEQFNDIVEPYTYEMITAAEEISTLNGSDVTLLVLGSDLNALTAQLNYPNVRITAVQTSLSAFQDDALSTLVAGALEKMKPSSVLIPATRTSRALFSRVAVKLGAGMTADCSQLFLGEDKEFLQKKSAFGENAMVVTREIGEPKFVTIQVGVYPPCPCGEAQLEVECLKLEDAASAIEVLETTEGTEQSIAGAELVISLGRGVLEAESMALAEELAAKTGGVIGGTRPLIDEGIIPFERQIGQTGCVVHPLVCLYFGVSGAIQHTEGVRDAKLSIAVNSDPDAAIFGYADYGVAVDLREILKELVCLYK